MFYGEDLIEEVRSRNPIVDVIGSYVHLTKKGGNYFGLCPFHNEKTGSFSVSPGRQMYHCFGCGAGGNVISFVMDYENISFPEAMEMLAKRAGIELPQREYTPEMKQQADKRSQLLQAHKDAAIFYHHVLRSEAGKIGYDYFKKRELSDDTIRSFGLGFAPARSGELYRYLKSKGYSDELLKDSSLVSFNERGAHDRFWNRVMFPIMDANNRVIAFGGRVLGDGEPKYLNSSETDIFNKSRNLYGLNVARHTKEKYMLACEGYMDVIAMHQAGFTNAVASLGTAFTPQHGMILKRYTEEVVLCYDSDGAGVKAALRAIPLLKEAGLKIKVLNMRPYKDPDEFMKAEGPEAFRKRISEAENAFIFEIGVLRNEYDFSDPEDKSRFFNETARRISGLSDDIERSAYIEAVANRFGIDYSILKSRVSQMGNEQGLVQKSEETWKPRKTTGNGQKKESGSREAQKLVLTTLIGNPDYYKAIKDILSAADFDDGLYTRLANMIFYQLEAGKINGGEIMNHFIDDEESRNEASRILNMELMEDTTEDEMRQAFKEAVIKVKENALERKSREAKDPAELMKALEDKMKLRGLVINI